MQQVIWSSSWHYYPIFKTTPVSLWLIWSGMPPTPKQPRNSYIYCTLLLKTVSLQTKQRVFLQLQVRDQWINQRLETENSCCRAKLWEDVQCVPCGRRILAGSLWWRQQDVRAKARKLLVHRCCTGFSASFCPLSRAGKHRREAHHRRRIVQRQSWFPDTPQEIIREERLDVREITERWQLS